jgi:hypothetical protein
MGFCHEHTASENRMEFNGEFSMLFSQLPPILHNSFYEKILLATDFFNLLSTDFLKDRYCCVCDGRE